MSRASDSKTGVTTQEFLRSRTADGWKGFVEHYGRTIRRWCRRCWRLDDEKADEVTQRVVVKLFERMRKDATLWDPAKGSFHAWLRTVARHAWLDARDEARRDLAPGGNAVLELLENDAVTEDFVNRLAQDELVQVAQDKARARVSAKEWEVFRLRIFDKCSAEEVAGQVGLSVGTVNNYTSKVRALLKEELDQLEGPSEE